MTYCYRCPNCGAEIEESEIIEDAIINSDGDEREIWLCPVCKEASCPEDWKEVKAK